MAQLRDIQTSEFIFEGTPEECVLLADKIGRDEVLFDGVGEAFDPDAVLTNYNDRLAAEVALSTSKADGITAQDRSDAQARAQQIEQVAADIAASQPGAEQALADARARLED